MYWYLTRWLQLLRCVLYPASTLLIINKLHSMNTKELLGNHIKKLRTEKNISQRRFALMVGLDRTFLSTIENGRQNVSIETLEKIALGLDINLIELFKGIEY